MRKLILTGMAVAMLAAPAAASAASPAYTTDTVSGGGSIVIDNGIATFNVPDNSAYGVLKLPQTGLQVKDIDTLSFESKSSAGGGMVYMSVVTNDGHKIKYTPYEQTDSINGGFLPELGGIGSWYTHNPMAAGVRLNGIADTTPTKTWDEAVSELGNETVNRVSITAGASLGHGTVQVDNITLNDSVLDFNDDNNHNPGAQGPKGDNGTDGTNGTNGVAGKDGAAGSAGKDGVTTVVHVTDPGTIAGATVRNLHIRKIAGMKFVSAKATLKGKKLAVAGRTIKVDLTGKSVGEYRVHITSKFKAGGKTFKVRSIRSLNIVSK
jgi:hypothetical protein